MIELQTFDWLRRRHRGQPDQAETVVLANAIVVIRIAKGQREQPLLLQIGLVDAREAAGNDGRTAEQSRREGGMLAAAALAVVPVADDDPSDSARAVAPGDFRHRVAGFSA